MTEAGDTFAVLDEHTVAYLDLFGSGSETIAHLRDNGRITGTDLGGSVTATSDNGSIELSFATAPDLVVASSDNGSVTVALPRVEGGYDVRTSGDNNADVEVVDDPSSPRMVDLETDNGSITIRDRG